MTPASPVTLSTFNIDRSVFKKGRSTPVEVRQKTGMGRLEDAHLVNFSLISLSAGSWVSTQSTAHSSLSTFSRMNAFTSSLGHYFTCLDLPQG